MSSNTMDSSAKALIFGGGLLIGSAVAFGAAYGVSRYMMERIESRTGREKYRSRDKHGRQGGGGEEDKGCSDCFR